MLGHVIRAKRTLTVPPASQTDGYITKGASTLVRTSFMLETMAVVLDALFPARTVAAILTVSAVPQTFTPITDAFQLPVALQELMPTQPH